MSITCSGTCPHAGSIVPTCHALPFHAPGDGPYSHSTPCTMQYKYCYYNSCNAITSGELQRYFTVDTWLSELPHEQLERLYCTLGTDILDQQPSAFVLYGRCFNLLFCITTCINSILMSDHSL
eukprot:scpid63666/ scgid8116/ 